MTETMDCPCCAANVDQTFHDTAYLRCSACGALLSTVPEASYEQDYYYHRAEFEAEERRRGELLLGFFRRVVREVPAHLRPTLKGDLLEFGCSRGYFVEACLARGLRARGVDISDKAITSAKRRGLGNVCLRADVQALESPARLGQADVVVAWELLEHFDSPKAFLNAVRRHLKPGGWFLGSTPNGGSSWLRLLREGWHGCGIPQYHRVYYNQDAVRSAFAVAGFDNVATTTCVDWKGSLLIKNTATILTRRHLQTNNIIVRAVVAGAIAAPQKAAEVLSGHVPWIDGDTLLFAARSCPDVPLQ